MQVRRLVTGEVDAKSVVVSDEPVDPVTIALVPDNEFHRLWGADTVPSLAPGTVTTPTDLDVTAAMAEVEDKLPGLAASLEPDHPGMHRTATVDFDCILSGEAWLLLDDGVEVPVAAGDCVVVDGQRHSWANRAAQPCVMVTVGIGGPTEETRRPDPGEPAPGIVEGPWGLLLWP